jgi:hypothetical protein
LKFIKTSNLFSAKIFLNMPITLESLNKEIEKIKERNKKVEIDKAWETSKTRRFLLAIFTYLTIGFYLQAIKIDQPWLNAIVPSIGFLLSTLTLPFFKEVWKKWRYKKDF